MIRTVFALCLGLSVPVAGHAGERFDQIVEAMQLRDLFTVMEAEGQQYGAEIEKQMFPGAGGESWRADVEAIYDADRVLPAFLSRVEASLDEAGADEGAILEFFQSDLGHRIGTLEVSARRAYLDPSVEDAARLTYDDMRMAADPRLQLVDRFIGANDLVEVNVSGAMNASLAFYRGLMEAGAMDPATTTDADLLEDVWSQEPQIRADTEEWIYSYLTLAYAPLSDAEIEAYIDFSQRPEGRALNQALFSGFNTVFEDVSLRLGRRAGARLTGLDL